MDHDDNNKRKRNTEPTPEDFVLIGKDIQNKSGRSGAPLTEVRAFREFFGTTAVVVAKLWSLLSQRDMIPEQGRTNHLMWALFFMRAYPKEGVTCATVGGSGGAIDPKTFTEIYLAIHPRHCRTRTSGGEFFVSAFLHEYPRVGSPYLF